MLTAPGASPPPSLRRLAPRPRHAVTEFFCADESRRVGEDFAGTAGTFGTYALIECPGPWAANAFESAQIPDSLRTTLAVLDRIKASARPLLFRGETTKAGSGTKLVVYHRKEGPSDGYAGLDFDLQSLEGVGTTLAKHVLGRRPGTGGPARTTPRDILNSTGTN